MRPKKLSDNLLDRSLKRARLKRKVEQYAFITRWAEIVGEDVAAVSKPEKILHGKVLVVRALSSAWVQELTLRKSDLLDRLASSGVLLEDIRFIAGNPRELKTKN
jgi:predicted nucleic acid-binding Zn ribbon protein